MNQIKTKGLNVSHRLSLSLSLSLGLLSVTAISGAALTSSAVSADDSVVDKINITVPVSCTLAGTGMNTHNASVPNGTYQADIGTTTLKAFCNDNAGFAIYATGYTGNEIGATNSNKLVGTPASIGNIATGTATSGNTSNWAMKLTTTTNPTPTYPITIDNGFSSYKAVPNEYTKVAHRDSSTDIGTNATGSTLTTTYAAYMSSTQGAGTYSGQVIYTLVHPASHAAPVVCNPNATTIAEVKCLQDFGNVNSTNRAAIFNSMVPEQQYTMKDSRDGKTYTIAKFQTKYIDPSTGNEATAYDIWMTQNLDLDLQAGVTYTNEDTDIGYNTQTGEYGTAAWSPTRSTYAATNTQTHEWCAGGTWNSQYSYCEVNDTPESYDPGDLYWNLTESDSSDWDTYYNSCDFSTSTPSCNQSLNPISTYTSSTGTAQYHLGNYYNWAAALATNDSSVYDNDDLVEQSICPAGWTLPRIGTGEDSFYALWNQYGFANGSYDDADEDGVHDANENALWTSPLYFAASGLYGGVLGNVGYDGSFWSPVADGMGAAGLAHFNVAGYARPSYGDGRSYGGSVRCVARPVVSSYSESGGGGPEGPVG